MSVCAGKPITFHGVHHVALICENLERSLEFYQGVLGEQQSKGCSCQLQHNARPVFSSCGGFHVNPPLNALRFAFCFQYDVGSCNTSSWAKYCESLLCCALLSRQPVLPCVLVLVVNRSGDQP